MQAVRYVIRYLHASTHTHSPQSQHTRGLKSRFPLKGCGINCLHCLLNFSNEGAMKRFSNCYICVKQTWNWSVLSTMSVVTKVKCQDHCSESRLQGLNTTNWGTMAASWKHEWIASLKKIMAHQQKYCILLHKEQKDCENTLWWKVSDSMMQYDSLFCHSVCTSRAHSIELCFFAQHAISSILNKWFLSHWFLFHIISISKSAVFCLDAWQSTLLPHINTKYMFTCDKNGL